MKRIKMTHGEDTIEVHVSRVEEMKTKGWELAPPEPILTAGYSPESIEVSEGVTYGDIDSTND